MTSRLVLRRSRKDPHSRNRPSPKVYRTGMFSIILGLTALAVTILCAIYARFVHPFRPRITHTLIPLPRSHKHLDGLSLAFVTDTHVGPSFPARALEPVIQILRRAKPDIVLFGGDYISESPRYLAEAQGPMADMAATARIGAWGVLGNHDIANIRGRVLESFSSTGITFLNNEATEIHTPQGSFWLVGIDDSLLGRAEPETAFRDVPVDALSIALWHEPDHAEKIEPFGPLLILSGHSHGGQVRLPFIGPIAAPKLGREYPSGRYDIGSTTLFVSNGIGIYRPPIRFNCPPEVVIVRLIG